MPCFKHSFTLDLSEHVADLSVQLDGDPVKALLVRHNPETGNTTVGYLLHDEDCESPLVSCEGMGQIYTARRSASAEHLEAFRVAKGLDASWRHTRKPDHLALSLDVYSHSGEVYAISGSVEAMAFPDRQWDVGSGSAVWVPDAHCRDTIWINAVERLLPDTVSVAYKSSSNPDGSCITRAPKPGEKPYFSDGTCIDERYNNRITLSIPGKKDRVFKSFKAAYRAALAALDIGMPEDFVGRCRQEAARMCEGVLESYNAWLSGDCYGVIVEVFDRSGTRIDEDSCWGYVGTSYAKKELHDRFIERWLKDKN